MPGILSPRLELTDRQADRSLQFKVDLKLKVLGVLPSFPLYAYMGWCLGTEAAASSPLPPSYLGRGYWHSVSDSRLWRSNLNTGQTPLPKLKREENTVFYVFSHSLQMGWGEESKLNNERIVFISLRSVYSFLLLQNLAGAYTQNYRTTPMLRPRSGSGQFRFNSKDKMCEAF
jgi:hypothetical protein